MREITVDALFAPAAGKSADYMLKKDVLLHWNPEKIYLPEMHEAMPRLLGWEYPFASEMRLHTKMTVSELKRLSQLREYNEENDSVVMYAAKSPEMYDAGITVDTSGRAAAEVGAEGIAGRAAAEVGAEGIAGRTAAEDGYVSEGSGTVECCKPRRTFSLADTAGAYGTGGIAGNHGSPYPGAHGHWQH